ncbi:hypothetical protein BJY01DRAFT_222021 [Aspergillus pseudoustus]|uniref:Uncharacterized protein n=1 Tax=Aspergillus pseudoustus TaxID=1810923 RepID=A0ABR4J8L7_9EURO
MRTISGVALFNLHMYQHDGLRVWLLLCMGAVSGWCENPMTLFFTQRHPGWSRFG